MDTTTKDKVEGTGCVLDYFTKGVTSGHLPYLEADPRFLRLDVDPEDYLVAQALKILVDDLGLPVTVGAHLSATAANGHVVKIFLDGKEVFNLLDKM